MPWVRFTSQWDWRATPAVTIAYRSGQELLVTTACAKAAVGAGTAVRIKKGGGDGKP